MNKKLALKKLSASDLTFFEYHYRNTSGAKQKAINLDAAVFVKALFPGLPGRLDVSRDRVIVTLAVHGPGGANPHSITRKILKQQKNWRLNGELISNPPEEVNRYDSLMKGDYAILDFTGDIEPSAARMYLVGESYADDTQLHRAFEQRYGKQFSSHKGMLEIDGGELAELLGKLSLPDGHPVLDFIDYDALEDAALGGHEGASKLRRGRKSRGVSREELRRAKQSAENTGRQGEEFVRDWLDRKYSGAIDLEYRWDADTNAVSPYDFTIMEGGKSARRIDVKSTSGDFGNAIHISYSELYEMTHGELPYDIYRMYSTNDEGGRLRIARDVKKFAKEIFDLLEKLPNGVKADGISVSPDMLNFEDEISIIYSNEYEY